MYYEKCQKNMLDTQMRDAMTLVNALYYTSTSETRQAVNEKKRAWKNFIRSIDWKVLTKKPDNKSISSVLSGLGVPMLKSKKKDGASK